MNLTRRWLLLVLVAALMLSGCGISDAGPGEVRERTLSLPLEGATEVNVEIWQNAGWLQLEGGASGLLDAELTYNETLDPQIERTSDGPLSSLTIRQPEAGDWADEIEGASSNGWLLKLSDSVAADITLWSVDTQLSLDLANVPTRALRVHGDRRNMSLGIGGEQLALRTVTVESDSGEAWLAMEGSYAAIDELSVTTTSGRAELVLLGEWSEDVSATVSTESGPISVHVPPDTGVAIEATTGGQIVAGEGFRQDGNRNRWVNDAYGSATVTLTLRLTSARGEITFRVDQRQAATIAR